MDQLINDLLDRLDEVGFECAEQAARDRAMEDLFVNHCVLVTRRDGEDLQVYAARPGCSWKAARKKVGLGA